MTHSDDRRDAPSAIDPDAPLDPAAMYALLQNQQRSVETQINGFVPYITLGWGLTWLVGFGALWLIDGARPAFALPLGLAIGIFVVCILATGGLSAWLGIRSGRGMRSNSAAAMTGAFYGVTWSVGATGIGVLGGALVDAGMTRELANFYYPTAYVMFAGIMYMISGAIWHAVPSFVAGIWLVVIAATAPFFGYPHHYLFLALAGGLAFIGLSVGSFVQRSRLRRATTGGAGRG
jgi:hypothetical protein